MSDTSAEEKTSATAAGSEGAAPGGASDPAAPAASDVDLGELGEDGARASDEIDVDVVLAPPVPGDDEATGAPATGDAPSPLRFTSTLPPRSWPPRVVSDLMTRTVLTVSETEAIGDLEEWMNRFRFHHLPVVGEGMKLVGLITRTDYLHAMLGVGPDGKPTPKASAESPAGAIMRKNVVTARLDSPLTTACQVMLQEKLGCLPVILDDSTLVGILTESDFVRLTLQVLEQQG